MHGSILDGEMILFTLRVCRKKAKKKNPNLDNSPNIEMGMPENDNVKILINIINLFEDEKFGNK